uniref:Uncharacterized protein n=1 Tax=Gasterosteus aculeatus TaxID=69293 RepID=G3NX95_GASAC
MAQHILGFSGMASYCMSCLGIRSLLSHKHPALSDNRQHAAAYRASEMTLAQTSFASIHAALVLGWICPALPWMCLHSAVGITQFIQRVAKPEYESAFVLAGRPKRSLWSH